MEGRSLMRFYTVEIGKEGMPRVMVTAEVAAHMSREGHEMVPWMYEDGITLEELRALDGGSEALARWMAGDDSALNAHTMLSGQERAGEARGTIPGQEGIEWPAPGEAVNHADRIDHLDFGVDDLDLGIDVPSKSQASDAGDVDRASRPTADEIEDLWGDSVDAS
jgi:hypothetical protein